MKPSHVSDQRSVGSGMECIDGRGESGFSEPLWVAGERSGDTCPDHESFVRSEAWSSPLRCGDADLPGNEDWVVGRELGK